MKECCKKYLDEQFGDDGVVKEIYDEYAVSAHEKIAEAGAALAAGDWTLLDRVAHTLKGNALAAGDEELANTAIELRKAATLKDASGAAALHGRLKDLEALL